MCSWCSKFNCTVFFPCVFIIVVFIFIERCVPNAVSLYYIYSEVGDNVFASGCAPLCVRSVSACFWQLICRRFCSPGFRKAAAKGDRVLLASRLCWQLAQTNGQACAYSYCWSCLMVRQHSLAVRGVWYNVYVRCAVWRCNHMGLTVCFTQSSAIPRGKYLNSTTCVQPISSVLVYHMTGLKTCKNGQMGLQNPWLC